MLPTSAFSRSIQGLCGPGDVHDGTGAIAAFDLTTELDSELVEHGRWCYEIGAQFERNGKFEEAMEMLRQYLAIAQRLHVLFDASPPHISWLLVQMPGLILTHALAGWVMRP